MAITVNGVTGSVTDVEWAQLWQDAMDGGREESVATGLQVTPSSGRVLAVSAGRSFQSGASVVYTGGSTVTIAANTASSARIDTVCMQVNWAGTETTAGTLVVVQGVAAANPVARALTKTPGGIWQTPLAYVRVAAGAATISAANITDARPGAATQTFTSLSIPAASASTWTQPGAAPLGVQRSGAWVELSGRLTFTASNQPIGTNLQFSNVPIIPDGYRPLRDEVATCYGNPGSGNVNEMIFHTDGTVDFWVVVGTLTTGNVLRVTTTSWIGA